MLMCRARLKCQFCLSVSSISDWKEVANQYEYLTDERTSVPL